MMDRNEAHAIYISSQSIDIINMTYRLKTVVPATQVKQFKLVMVVLLSLWNSSCCYDGTEHVPEELVGAIPLSFTAAPCHDPAPYLLGGRHGFLFSPHKYASVERGYPYTGLP